MFTALVSLMLIVAVLRGYSAKHVGNLYIIAVSGDVALAWIFREPLTLALFGSIAQ